MKPSAGAFFIFYLGISACLGFGVPNFPLFLSAINKRKLSNSSKSFFASSDKISPTEEKNSILIGKAREVVESNFGLNNPNLLADDFSLFQIYRRPLSKAEHLKEFTSYNLDKAFPDLQFNSHDFRVDKKGNVVLTIRIQGTHRGILTYQNKIYEPTFKRIDLGPECVSVKFSTSGQCIQITCGFHLDREVGNGGGVGGIWGILSAIGYPISMIDRIPPGKIIPCIFARSFRPKFQPTNKRMPIAEPIMIGLTRQVAQVQLGDCKDIGPNLSKDFVYMEPYVGPLKKKGYLKLKSRTQLGRGLTNLNLAIYDLRMDPFDPARVWYTVQTSGTFTKPVLVDGEEILPTNKSFTTAPEAGSVTFDRRGFVTKLTLGYPMGVEECSTYGLVGTMGLLEGMGLSQGFFNTRPLPESTQLFFESIKQSIADSFSLKALEKPSEVLEIVKSEKINGNDDAVPEIAKKPAAEASAAPLKATKAEEVTVKSVAIDGAVVQEKNEQRKEIEDASKDSAKASVTSLFKLPKMASKDETAPPTNKENASKDEKIESKQQTKVLEKETKAAVSKPQASVSKPQAAVSKPQAAVLKSAEKASEASEEANSGMKMPNFLGPMMQANSPSSESKEEKKEEEVKSKITAVPAKTPPLPPQHKMSSALESKIEKVAGKSGLVFLQSRLSAYMKGAISANDFLGSLRKSGCIELLSEIADELPLGTQQKALNNFAKK